MPTTGAYSFKRAASADASGVVPDEGLSIQPGEWGWVKRKVGDTDDLLCLYIGCPDCKHLGTIYIRFNRAPARGHDIGAQGNVHPSVLHTWKDNGVEQCGFHTQPTTLLDFVDVR
jgi:hypothetical protein